MSVDSYRRQVDRLISEMAALEMKAAGERDRAAQERASALRAQQSISRTTSAATARSRMADAQRHEANATRHDRQAGQLATQIATKQRSLSDSRRSLERLEASERRKLTEEDRRRERAAAIRYARESAPGTAVEASPAPAPTAELTGRRDTPEVPYAADESAVEIVRPVEEGSIDVVLEMSKAVALGALASVPVLGPVLREVVGISWGDDRAERLHRFALQLGRDVESLQARIDREFVSPRDFEALAEEAMERVVQRKNEEKIGAFSAAVANSATLDRPGKRLRERYLDWLDSLRPIHIAILQRLAIGRAGWARPPDVITVGQVAGSRLAYVHEDLQVDRHDMQELERRELIGSLNDTVTLMAAADDPSALVTPAGHALLAFISTGPEDGQGEPEPAPAPSSDD